MAKLFHATPISILCLWSCTLSVCSAVSCNQDNGTVLHTGTGVQFGMVGRKGPSPQPTLFVFADTVDNTFRREDLKRVTQILAKSGYLFVSLDLPCHGKDAKVDDPPDQLTCWRARLERGDDFVEQFMQKVSAVLDFLVNEGYTDPNRVAACGVSRGGYIALQFAGHDSRVSCVFAFAPVTDLMALREFAGIENSPDALRLVRSLALSSSAERLAERSIWLTIGNYDLRVSTGDTIAFSRRVVQAAISRHRPADLELHVMTNVDHSVSPDAPEEAAAWLQSRIRK